MALTTERLTLDTTGWTLLASCPNPQGATDAQAMDVDVLPQVAVGTILIAGNNAPAESARWDLSKLAALTRRLEPGEELYCRAAADTIDVDVIRSGR